MKQARIIGLFLLSFVVVLYPYLVASAAPLTPAKQSAAPLTPAQPSAPNAPAFNPNAAPAPPQGTITITTPNFPPAYVDKGPTTQPGWYMGSYQPIEWTCNGTKSNLVDVTLWKGNQQFAVIGTDVATGRTAYTIPQAGNGGIYELRVTSKRDTRVEARKTVWIFPAEIKVVKPDFNSVFPGTSSFVTWEYKGNPGPVNVRLMKGDSDNTVQTIATNLSPGSGGSGGVAWVVPQVTKGNYSIRVNSVATLLGHGRSLTFEIYKPPPTPPIVVSADYSLLWGIPFTITWAYVEGLGNAVKIDLLLSSSKKVITTLSQATPIGSNGKGSFTWTIPYGHCKDAFTVMVTSLAKPTVFGTADLKWWIFERKPGQPPPSEADLAAEKNCIPY